ncbi:MAG TPA: TolC family protein [Phycisphaerae bacterium]|nr:TolC family protein [Phycisphaerae bacterium]
MGIVRRQWIGLCGLALIAAWLWSGCAEKETRVEDIKTPIVKEHIDQRFVPAPDLRPIDDPPVALNSNAPAATQPVMDEGIWVQIPDPAFATEAFGYRLRTTRFSPPIKKEYEGVYEDTRQLISEIERPKKFRLGLADALKRSLAHNYQITVDGFAPAISTAQIVQAEAAFDEAFFFNANRDNDDRPQPFIKQTPLQQRAFENDTTIVNGGIRKLLTTGAQISFTQQMTRLDAPANIYRQWQPLWSQNFITELRQPLLKNFGIDFNRAQINIRKNERLINEEAFRARVIDTLNQTERAYWALVGARRDVVVSAELLAEAKLTLRQVRARSTFDAYQTLLFRSEVAVKGREFEYIDVKNRVRNSEDQLLNLINDPDIPLSADYEIIPIDTPTSVEIIRDRFHEVETALEKRPEVLQARYSVDTTRIQLGVAKNQALPQLNAVWRMTVNGVGGNADNAWDQETGGDFIDQYVGIEFLWNFGERAERAGIRIAALQQSQAVARYKKALDDVITDCRVAMRNLDTSFQQLSPSYDAVLAGSENLRSLQERQERKSPEQLDTVLSSQISLRDARRALLQALVSYNQGIVDVERSKGTLLEYDNVALTEQP